MKESDLIKLFAVLEANYRNFITPELLPGLKKTWYQLFQPFPTAVVENAVFEFISTSKFPPTIADIKEIIYRQNTLTGYTFDEYWQMMMNGYKKGVYVRLGYSYWEAYKEFPKELKEVLTYEEYHDLAHFDEFRRYREKERIKAAILSKRESLKREFITAKDPVAMLPHMNSLLQLNTKLNRKDNG